ncbi:hypothetical protein Tco_0025340 [Tanacetum coccineum]
MFCSSATWDERMEIVEVKVSSFVGISKRSLGSSISMSLTCCFNSLISLDISVIFKGSSFSSVGKQLAKSCEAKSLDSSGLKKLPEVQSAANFGDKGGGTEVSSASLSFSASSSSSLLSETMIGSFVGESGVKKVDLVSFKIFEKSSSFTFCEMSLALDSSFAREVVWALYNQSLADLVLSTRTLGLDPVRSASAVKSAEASCPDANSEYKIKEAD